MSDAATTPLLLPLDRLSLPRRLLILAGLSVPVMVWAKEASESRGGELGILLMLVGPVVATAALSNLNHVGAQLMSRGLWWFHLLFGTVAAVGGRHWEPALLAAGAGAALLASGSAGLEAGVASRGAFEPKAFRRSLMVSIAMAAAEVQLLSLGAAAMVHDRKWGYAAAAGLCAAALAAAALGIYRLRFWGVLLHLVSMVGVASLVATALRHAHRADPLLVWVATVSTQVLLPLPMLLAIVRRAPVRDATPSALPRRLFAALVVAMAGSSLASVAAQKLF